MDCRQQHGSTAGCNILGMEGCGKAGFLADRFRRLLGGWQRRQVNIRSVDEAPPGAGR